MQRINQAQKKIAEAHIAAKQANKYDDPQLDGSLDCLKKALLDGKTIRYIMETIETRYTSVGSQLLASPALFGHHSKNYKAGVYKGFKEVLTNLKIN
jgi:hypothetical protein